MLSTHQITDRHNSEVVPLRNSREDLGINTTNNSSCCNTNNTNSPIHISIVEDGGGGGGNRSDNKTASITMGDDTKRLLIKVVIDVTILCSVGFPILFFFLWASPYKRGFFCDDESLKHPFHESTVRNYVLYMYGIGLPIAIILITEYMRVRIKGDTKRFRFYGYDIPDWITNAYSNIVVFGFGAACTQLAVDIGKYSIGRFRPHFFDVCKPKMLDGTTCDDEANHGKYIENFTCDGKDEGSTERMLKEMRLSFPSGHSSFSLYTMVYAGIYLHSRFNWEGSKLLKHFIQYLLVLIAWYTCLSRISDYKHHWSDVLSGACLGVIGALITSQFISDLFEKHKSSLLPTTRYELRTSNHVNSNGNN
jgi:phosphatidate phosphatase